MKKWIKRNMVNILIACVIGIPISLYGISQQPKQTIAEPQEVIEYKPSTETSEVSIETLNSVPKESSRDVTFFNVPLSEDLQLHIFEECEKHNIAPTIVIAVIERESNYDVEAIGDNGKSLGLMQIQPKWHRETMDKLGCEDLLDPYQNITVGVDIISQLKNKNPDIYWVLMAYNGGEDYATKKITSEDYSDYAVEVVIRALELETTTYGD